MCRIPCPGVHAGRGASALAGCGSSIPGLRGRTAERRRVPCGLAAHYHDRASTITLAGTLYGLGCFLTAILVAGTYYVYTVTAILILFAAIPGLFIIVFAKGKFPNEVLKNELPLRQVINDFKNPGAVLFALLLFFQFGNEWSIAGWLPIFLIRRLGVSPEGSLWSFRSTAARCWWDESPRAGCSRS